MTNSTIVNKYVNRNVCYLCKWHQNACRIIHFCSSPHLVIRWHKSNGAVILFLFIVKFMRLVYFLDYLISVKQIKSYYIHF